MEHRTKKAHYGYVVTTEKMAPLAGGRFHYAAKVTRLLRYNDKSPATELPVPMIGEVWGATQNEAERKAEAALIQCLNERDAE